MARSGGGLVEVGYVAYGHGLGPDQEWEQVPCILLVMTESFPCRSLLARAKSTWTYLRWRG